MSQWITTPHGWRRDVPAPDLLVIVLHGYGRSGGNITERLARPLADALPNAAFFAPDGFEPYEGTDREGRQWFSREGITPAVRLERLRALQPRLQALIDAELQRTALPPQRLVLAGFSQGAIIALHQAAELPQRLAGVIAYGGRLATPVSARNGTPVTIVHGGDDGSLDEVHAGAEAFRAAGHAVALHVIDGLAHDIDPRAIAHGRDALRAAAALTTASPT